MKKKRQMAQKWNKEKQRLMRLADNLWKEKCFEKWGRLCEICGQEFLNTPHHYYYKSAVPFLRYEVLNGVILCCRDHAKLHFKDPKEIEEKIVAKRGKKWLNKLKRLKNKVPKYFKTDLRWYEKEFKRLQN